MNNAKLGIGLVAVLVIATIGVFTPFGKTVVEKVIERPLGAVSTLDGVDSPFVSIGGRRTAQKQVAMLATSSALCSLSPADVGRGTSTARFSFKMSTSSIARSEYVSLSTSTSRYGSSTNAWLHVTVPQYGSQFGAALFWNSATSTASGAGITNSTFDPSLWYGTNASGTSAYIVLPNEYLNLRIGTSTAGTFATFPQGTCSYEFIEL